jgi:hypothetical protein
MNALLIGLLLFIACFTANQCYEVMESKVASMMPRREVIRTLLNLQAPTNPHELGTNHCSGCIRCGPTCTNCGCSSCTVACDGTV